MDRRTAIKTIFASCAALTCFGATAETPVNRLAFLLERRGFVRIGLGARSGAVTVSFSGAGEIISGAQTLNVPSPVSVISRGGTVVVSSGGKEITTGSSITLNPISSVIKIGDTIYRGGAIFRSAGSSVSVVNLVQIDDWLKGVLPAEIGADSLVDALRAQAIVARSEAIFRLKKPPHDSDGYDFCTGVHCQAYKGIQAENEPVIKACDDTLGYVLLAAGDIVNAVYHNVCGGVTAPSEDVWVGAPVPGLTAVFDAPDGGSPDLKADEAARQFILNPDRQSFCHPENPKYANYAKKYFRWRKTLSAGELQKMAGVGRVTDISVAERRASGRVRRLVVTGSSGSKTIERELPIRQVFDLWSGLFVIDITRSGQFVESVTFTGAGNGHGVGLCQHGAREIARRGGTFSQILKHYYPTAELRKVYRP